MGRSLYRIRVYCGGDAVSWHKQAPDLEFATHAYSLGQAAEKFFKGERWPYLAWVADVRRDGDTMHVWAFDC